MADWPLSTIKHQKNHTTLNKQTARTKFTSFTTNFHSVFFSSSIFLYVWKHTININCSIWTSFMLSKCRIFRNKIKIRLKVPCIHLCTFLVVDGLLGSFNVKEASFFLHLSTAKNLQNVNYGRLKITFTKLDCLTLKICADLIYDENASPKADTLTENDRIVMQQPTRP